MLHLAVCYWQWLVAFLPVCSWREAGSARSVVRVVGTREAKKEKDPRELQIFIQGNPCRFTDYTREFTRQHYPQAAHQSIVVPPVTFHDNWLISNKDGAKKLQECSVTGGAKRPVTVADLSQKTESTRRGAVAEYVVVQGFRHLGRVMGGPNAVISGYKMENYLNKVKNKLRNVGLPGDVEKNRGEHDLLVISPPCGVMVVSVKSVGGNFADLSLSVEEQKTILRKVLLGKAIEQLDTEVRVTKHVLSDLSPPVTCALALPNIARGLLLSVLSEPDCRVLREKLDALLNGDSSKLCLCLEEFPPPVEHIEDHPSSDDSWKERLMEWWGHRFPTMDPSNPVLPLEQYEDVFGRYCGLFSTVEIPHRKSEPGKSVEVRHLPEAVSEVSRRFRSLLLLPNQVEILCSPNRRVYLHGVMGSGKSVMLFLKACQWLNRGCDVILLNVGYDGLGSPVGYRLLDDIQQSLVGEGKITLLNVRLSTLDKTQLLQQIRGKRDELRAPCREASSTSGSGGEESRDQRPPVHFLLDEVYPKFLPVFEVLQEGFPDSDIWAAGLDGENAPSNLTAFEMTKVLRNPPSVQRILYHTDYQPSRRERYTACGAKEGLPSEGPHARFIYHQIHASPSPSPTSSSSAFSFMASYSPLNCKECTKETINIFSEIIGRPRENSSSVEEESGLEVEKTLIAEDLVPRVLLGDVVLLCKGPERRNIYPKQADGTYRLQEDLLREFMAMVDQSEFVNGLRGGGYPVRIVSDAHSQDLALSDQEALTASWVNPASGLEWAVVMFMPGDPAVGSSECLEPSEEADSETSRRLGSLATAPQASQPAGDQGLLSKTSEDPDVLSKPFSDPLAFSEPSKSHPAADGSREPPQTSSESPQSQRASKESAAGSGTHGGVEDAVEGGLRAMLSRMSKRDREYLFWSASRSTAQLIVLIP